MTVSRQTETLSIYKVEQTIKYVSEVAGNVTINPGDSQNKTIILYPNVTNSYTTYNLSGKIYSSDDGIYEIPGGSSVDLYIYNSKKGMSHLNTTYSSDAGYSVASPTFGPDCLIPVFVDDSNGNPLFNYYVKGIDFSDANKTQDFTQPDRTSVV